MYKGGKLRLAAAQTPFDGEWYRHAHAKQECGEYGVGKAKHVFVPAGVAQPVGNTLQGGNVVYEEHEKHGERAHHIYGGYALAGLGGHLSLVFDYTVCKFSTIILRRHLIIVRLGLNCVGSSFIICAVPYCGVSKAIPLLLVSLECRAGQVSVAVCRRIIEIQNLMLAFCLDLIMILWLLNDCTRNYVSSYSTS